MRKGLALGAKVSAIALSAAIAAPQVSFAQSGDDDVIIVTGSFIKRQNQADLPSPLQTVGAEDIDAIGATSIADITQTLTINSGAQNNPDAFTQSGTTGTTNINLRGLGLGSTLVLLNGGRQVTTATATNDGIQFVDTSSLIPLIAIERVEILKDGASALYGSDAVAGVVNFITRDSYEGIAFSGQYTSHQSRGDYNEFQLQGMLGKNFDRGNIMVAVEYSQSTPLTTRERRLSQPADDTSALGNPGAFFGFPGLPAGTPVIDPGCAAAGGFPTPVTPLDPTASQIGLCGFDFGEFFNLVTDNERFLTYGRAGFDLSDSVSFSVEGSYANNEDVRGNSPTFPFLQLGSAVIPGAAFGPIANPFNFFPGDPTLVFFGRASGNGGEVSPNFTENETWRGRATLGGDNFLNNGSWELAFTKARNNYTIMTEDTVTDRFQCALSGFGSVPAVPGLTGGTDCTSANPDLTANGSSVPSFGTFFNPFSTSLLNPALANDPALLDYVVQFQTRDLQSDLLVGEGYFSTDLFAIGDSYVGMAAGVQYRKTKLDASFDEISQRDGFAFLIGEQPYSGTQDVIAGFAEIAIPLAPWLDIQAAVRHERYGDEEGGSTTDPKIAVLVRPTDAVSFRGSYSTSFRAPSVFQQVGQGTSLQQVSDPANGGANAFVAVRAEGAARVGDALLPEDSRAFNLGATWQPLDGLQLSADYYNFSFENVVVPQNAQALLNADPFGSSILRSPAGTVVQINTQYVNASEVETSGLDFSASWELDTGRIGTLTPSITGTYVLEYDLIDPLAGPVSGEGSRNFANFGTSTPELRLNGGLAWQNGAHSANLFVRHIDSYLDDQNGNALIEADTRVDLQYSLSIAEYMDRDKLAAVTFGVRNLFDETAPYVATNGGFDSKVHDPRGRLLYFGLDLEL